MRGCLLRLSSYMYQGPKGSLIGSRICSLYTDKYGRDKKLMGVLSCEDLLGEAMLYYPKC